MAQTVYTVSQLNGHIKALLDTDSTLTGLFVHWLFGLSVRIFQLLLILFIKIRHIFPHFRYMISVSRFSIHSGSFRFALSMPPNNFRLTLSCLPAAPGSLSIYTILRTERISL